MRTAGAAVAGDRASGCGCLPARVVVAAAGRPGQLGEGAASAAQRAWALGDRAAHRYSFLTGLGDGRVGGVLVEAHRDLEGIRSVEVGAVGLTSEPVP